MLAMRYVELCEYIRLLYYARLTAAKQLWLCEYDTICKKLTVSIRERGDINLERNIVAFAAA